ncbi:hypothetical protein [Oceanicella actignis]|uniref:Uncharacterized protein n=1 Tax=Oceanicella actignis TaxID=1189325 RepID=A0A1M7SQ82_9RHOB|nr:hypothetical protein [Oceanicella actignis]SES66643.1 hypothetical protein SAMN04488119_10191 [Oceanicella actignis]SHN60655.1 hypothetical protein SAMN05216200_10392 [Oceanicella actignis]
MGYKACDAPRARKMAAGARVLAWAAALSALTAAGGCGLGGAALGGYDLPPEAAQDAEGDWPRLVDAPAPGETGEGADPGAAARMAQELRAQAAEAAARARALSAPVIPPEDLRRLTARR